MRSGLSLSEQELIIRVNAADPAFVEVDVTFPKYRRQLERWGFKPILTDSFGGARFRIPMTQLKPMRRSRVSVKLTPEQKARAAAHIKSVNPKIKKVD